VAAATPVITAQPVIARPEVVPQVTAAAPIPATAAAPIAAAADTIEMAPRRSRWPSPRLTKSPPAACRPGPAPTPACSRWPAWKPGATARRRDARGVGPGHREQRLDGVGGCPPPGGSRGAPFTRRQPPCHHHDAGSSHPGGGRLGRGDGTDGGRLAGDLPGPAGGLPAWATPDPSQAPVAQLAERVQLRVEETLGAWSRVSAENGWGGWVDGRRLIGLAAGAAASGAGAFALGGLKVRPLPLIGGIALIVATFLNWLQLAPPTASTSAFPSSGEAGARRGQPRPGIFTLIIASPRCSWRCCPDERPGIRILAVITVVIAVVFAIQVVLWPATSAEERGRLHRGMSYAPLRRPGRRRLDAAHPEGLKTGGTWGRLPPGEGAAPIPPGRSPPSDPSRRHDPPLSRCGPTIARCGLAAPSSPCWRWWHRHAL